MNRPKTFSPDVAIRHAQELRTAGQLDAAIAVLRPIVSAHPEHVKACAALVALLMEAGAHVDALAVAAHGLRARPNAVDLRKRAVQLLSSARLSPKRDTSRDKIRVFVSIVGPMAARALRETWGPPQDLAKSACDLIFHDPDFVILGPLPSFSSLNPKDAATFLGSAQVRPYLNNDLLAAVLDCALVVHPELERSLVTIRKAALSACLGNELPTTDIAELSGFLHRLAHYAFHGEYAIETADEEEESARRLLTRWRQAPSGMNAASFLPIVAAYFPLHRVLDGEDLERLSGEPTLKSLLREQVLEPNEESRLRPGIRSIGTIVDRVSIAVQAQYEDNPYPRWKRIAGPEKATALRDFLKASFIDIPDSVLPGHEGPRILVAGCGSGQHPIVTALRFRKAEVTAIDLSRASLAHAIRKTNELGLGNIEYVQGDLLAIGELGGQFDLIECVGVLHHLEDPRRGLKSLLAALKPGGFVHLGLYSRFAREHVRAARAFAQGRKFGTTLGDIRRCRSAIMDLDDGEPAKKILRSYDFYSASGCRDLILHAQEHQMSLGDVQAMLAENNLALLGFTGFDGRIREKYARKNPDDRTMKNWRALIEFEEAEPDAFSGMYQFWAYSKATP